MAPQHVRIRLLGGFDVQVNSVAVSAGVWRLNKARSLLKLLALTEGNRLHRDAIVEALWPELGAVAGTNNLHQALDAARRALAEADAAAPEVETTTLYRRLVTGQADARAEAHLHLPAPPTRFVGRQREIEELVALSIRNRLVTLSGPGGAGKTRLAVEVARALAKTSAYTDGLWMVDLSGVRDSELISATAASALRLTLSGARPTVAALTAQLAAGNSSWCWTTANT